MTTNSITMDEIIENLPTPVILVRHHNLIYGNTSFYEFYLPESAQDLPLPNEAKNIDIYNLVKKNSRGALREYLLNLSSLEKQFETILIASDNEYTPVLISGRCLNPSFPPEQRIHMLTATDISKKLKSEYLLYEMLEEIDEIFFVIDLKQKIQYINKRGMMLLRMNEDSIKGRVYSEIFNPLQWPHLQNLIDVCNKSMMPLYDKELTARVGNNGIRYYLANIIPIHDFQKTYSLLLITLKDITRFNVKINLASQLEKIIQSIPDPMVIVDNNLEVRLINNAAVELKGINSMNIREASTVLCSDIFKMPICRSINCPMKKLREKNENIRDLDVEIQDTTGRIRFFLLTIIPLEMQEEQLLYLMRFSDITTKKEYEKELKHFQEKLKEENVKLQQEITKMTITPVHETSSKKTKKMMTEKEKLLKTKKLEARNTYILTEENVEPSFTIFLNQVHSGKLGLIISRMHPEKIRKRFNLKETPIIWVNNSVVDEEKKYVQPNLQFLLHLIKNFLKDSEGKKEPSIILIDCLEYLTIFNDFKKIIQFYEMVNENITLYNSILIVNIDKNTFEPKEVALLKRNSNILYIK